MDFHDPDELAGHRAAARAWADANVEPGWADEQRRSGCHQTPGLHARFARDGILAAGWPPEYGGSDVDPTFARAVFDECARRGIRDVKVLPTADGIELIAEALDVLSAEMGVSGDIGDGHAFLGSIQV